jgi:F-type H+-transporting ATPase subunit epsilon
MAEFKLEIITPERVFFSGMAEYITVMSSEGMLSVLKGHVPMVATVCVGRILIKRGGEVLTAFTTNGFMEVRPDETLVFAQKCEWPAEIDVRRAHADEELASDRMQKKQSGRQYRENRIMLVRALARLQVVNSQAKQDQ